MVAAGALALGLVGVADTQAMATTYSSAFDGRYLYLTGSPVEGGGSACSSRQIYLAAGDYVWGMVTDQGDDTATIAGDGIYRSFDMNSPGVRSIYLAAGTYSWNDCITQHNGYYSMTSTLDAGYGPATLYASNIYLASGGYTVGSLLEH
ncbi:hypothetical protein [Kitasatospora aureofaciens]